MSDLIPTAGIEPAQVTRLGTLISLELHQQFYHSRMMFDIVVLT